MKIISWNVNGFRAVLKKGFLDFIETEKPEIICLQETKVLPEQLKEFTLNKYEQIWNPAIKKGYSGTAIFTKLMPTSIKLGMGIDEHDTEGRLITTEFDDFYLVNTYVPNSQHELARLEYRLKWDKHLRLFLLSLKKPTILCGDLNVAHKEIDIANPKGNKNNPGFSDAERESFTQLLDSGFIDSFRHFDKQPHRYSWWAYFNNARANNVGWRLDYGVVSKSFIDNIENSRILAEIHGSDHCPISLEIK